MIPSRKYFVALLLSLTVTLGFVTTILAPRPARAQAGLGALAGTVVDTSQAVVNGATVTLINQDLSFERQTITSSTGLYRFFALPVGGGYTVKVSAPGFKTTELKGITTSVGTTLTVDVTLQVGATVDTVEVSASQNVEQVQTETSAVSQLIDSEIWQNSPLESRTQNTFVLLTAGATPDSGTGRGASVDGARTGTGNFLVDGMDNNDQGLGGASTSGSMGGGGAVTTISPDAIQEYRVISHNLPAEYGRAGGFATDTVLKSGTKNWHGSLFEYNRVQALAAEHYFTKRSDSKDALVRNQFGGSVGGPVYKDKTFFYATVELHRMRTGSPYTGTTTTPEFLDFVKSGKFKAFMEGTDTYQDPSVQTIGGVDTVQIGLCPLMIGQPCSGALPGSASQGPIFQKLLAAEPTANPVSSNKTADPANRVSGGYWTTYEPWDAANSGVASIRYPVDMWSTTTRTITEAFDQNRGSMKFDHTLTPADQLSFAYLLDQFNDTSSGLNNSGSPFGPSSTTVGGAQNFSTTWTHTFSPTLLNLFRAGYLRHVNNVSAPGTQGVPYMYTLDPLFGGFGAYSGSPQLFTENEFLYQDSITKTLLKHALKAGFQYIRTRNGSSFYNDIYGTLLPWDTENLLTDATLNDEFEMNVLGGYYVGGFGQAGASIDPTTNQAPDPYRGFRSNEVAAYVQDDWKVNQRLTLNLGIRWDYFGPPHNFKKGFDSNVYFGAFGTPAANGNPFLPTTPFVGGVQGAKFIQKDSQIWNKDMRSIGPRFGFSYDVFGDGKMALRGGYGIGYDRLYNNVYENIRFNYPHFSDNTIGAYAGSSVPAGPEIEPGLYTVPFTANPLFKTYGGKPVPRHIDQRLVNAYYEQYNFGIEYQLKQGYVLETDFVGTLGRKLIGLQNINLYAGRTACPAPTAKVPESAACIAAGFPNGFPTGRISTLFNNDNFRTNAFSSNYSGLQASLRKGYSNGLQFMANYTYSKALDQVSDVFYQRNGGTGPTNPYRPAYDYGPADFDMKHNVVVTLNYQTQWKKKNLLLGGWGISPILKLNSGTPFTPSDGNSSYNPIKDGRTGIDRTVYRGTGSPKNAINHSISPANGYLKPKVLGPGNYFGPYSCPAGKLWCEPPSGRNSITGPAFKNLDLGVSKRFPTFEHQEFTLSGNFFNIFNHSNFDNPNADYNSSNYGKSLGTGEPRITQLSLRYDF